VTIFDGDVSVAFREIISCLASQDTTIVLTPEHNFVLSNALGRRMVNHLLTYSSHTPAPIAILHTLDACVNSFIDLHSSDDPLLLRNFVALKSPESLSAIQTQFEALLKANKGVLEREDNMRLKETAVNLKRFIKYKKSNIKL
jgi:hypothetical protein